MADLHDSTEHYLATIYHIEEEGVEIKRARIAERLNISAPSVTEHIHRMEKLGLVQVSENNSVSLTQEGRAKASAVVRRHRLAERLLVDVIGLDWAKAHNEADRWEHVISEEVEKHLLVLLKNPQTCPHGNPIPHPDGTTQESEMRLAKKISPLTSCKAGANITVRRIGESIEIDGSALEFVVTNSLVPGQNATVKESAKDKIVLTTSDQKEVGVPASIGQSMFVETV